MSEHVSIPCPACRTELLTGHPPPEWIACSHCGERFRSDGHPGRRTSGKAVVSCILGILALPATCLAGIPAVLLGMVALEDMRRAPRALEGRGLALAGIICGLVFSAIAAAVPFASLLLVARAAPDAQLSLGAPAGPAIPLPQGAVPLIGPDTEWRWLLPLDGADPPPEALLSSWSERGGPWRYGTEFPDRPGFGYGDPVGHPFRLPPEGQRYGALFQARFTSTAPFRQMVLTLMRDDGLIVFVDGREVARNNMPPPPADSLSTMAVDTIPDPIEEAVITLFLPGLDETGEHVLTLSLHNAATDSSDLRIGRIRLYGVP